MLKNVLPAALIFVLVLASNPAFAAEKAEVRANSKLTEIYTFGRTYADTCNGAPPPTFKIKKQPAHGRIVARLVQKYFSNNHKLCAGKPIKVFVVSYQPNRGYRGKDTASVSVRYDIYGNFAYNTNRTLRFDINVK